MRRFSFFLSTWILNVCIKLHFLFSFFIVLLLFSLTYLLIFSTDTDECKTTPQKCHVNAACNNTYGSYVCTCKPGYVGDGRDCAGTVNSIKNLWNLNSITCICLVVKSRYFFRFLKSYRDVVFHAAKSWHLSRGINLQQRKQIIHNYWVGDVPDFLSFLSC